MAKSKAGQVRDLLSKMPTIPDEPSEAKVRLIQSFGDPFTTLDMGTGAIETSGNGDVKELLKDILERVQLLQEGQ